jgi:hypothetical protein
MEYSLNSASNNVRPDWDLQVSLAVPSPVLKAFKNNGKKIKVNTNFMRFDNVAANVHSLVK